MRRTLLALLALLCAAPVAAQDLSDVQLRQRIGWAIARAENAAEENAAQLVHLRTLLAAVEARIASGAPPARVDTIRVVELQVDTVRIVLPCDCDTVSPPAPVDTVTPPPPPPPPPAVQGFPNLPADLPVQRHARWGGGIPAGWNITSRRGTPVSVYDLSSPTGGAIEFRYPAGHPDGHEVGVVWTSGPGNSADEMFLGVVMKYSDGWRSHNNEVKLHLWAGSGTWFGIFDGCWNGNVTQWKIAGRGLDPTPRPSTENCWRNNVAPSPHYRNGEWVTQELYVRRSTGTVMLWVNGVLLAEHHNVAPVRTMTFQEFQHAGTWGGGGGAVPAAQVWSVAETLIAWR